MYFHAVEHWADEDAGWSGAVILESTTVEGRGCYQASQRNNWSFYVCTHVKTWICTHVKSWKAHTVKSQMLPLHKYLWMVEKWKRYFPLFFLCYQADRVQTAVNGTRSQATGTNCPCCFLPQCYAFHSLSLAPSLVTDLLPTVRGGQELLLPQNTGVSSQRVLRTGPGT